MEENKIPSLREFAEKFIKVNGKNSEWRKADLEYFDMLDEARKQHGRELIFAGQNKFGYIGFLEKLHRLIKTGKDVYVPGLNKNRFKKTSEDLKRMGLKFTATEDTEAVKRALVDKHIKIGYIFKLSE